MYGLYGLKHHTVEISGDVTDAGRTDERTNERTNERTKEDNATQPLDAGRLSFAKCFFVHTHTLEISSSRIYIHTWKIPGALDISRI